MAFSGSMFLVEIIVEELTSYIKCKDFYISTQFANLFNLNLKNPNDADTLIPKKLKKLKKKKKGGRLATKPEPPQKVRTGQSVLFGCNIETLVSHMKSYPMQLSLWDTENVCNRLGFTHIPWNPVFAEYLTKIIVRPNLQPPCVTEEYNIFDEFTSKRMAVIKLNIKLTCLRDRLMSSFRSLSENDETFMYTGFNKKATSILSTIRDPNSIKELTGTIKTIYKGGKRKFKTPKPKSKKEESAKMAKEQYNTNGNNNGNADTKELVKVNDQQSVLSLVKSDTDLDKNRQLEVIKSKSCSSVNAKQMNILNYIFSNLNGPFGNQVYCVGYFTVHSDNATPGSEKVSGKSSVKSEESKTIKVNVCDNECENRTDDACAASVCSLHVPAEGPENVKVVRCRQIDCVHREHEYNQPPPPPDDRVILDLSSLKNKICPDGNQKIEEVTGGLSASMHISKDSCFCTCECSFGFVKKTTYCKICRGFERPGEDFKQDAVNTLFPCPIFHNLVDKTKKVASTGSDTKSRRRRATEKNEESEKDSKKGKKKKKDDRFKFNYGYTGIPPQIGHCLCCTPCSGTMGPVPKSMGWLWTAEDVPGLKFRPGWKPGATNKHVVRLLRMAKNPGEVVKKRRKDAGKKKKPLKRPLLVVHKKDGEFTVTMETMKTYLKPRALNQQPYEDKPVLSYTIGRTDEENRERKKKKERAQRRLERAQREFIQSAFKDMCKEICLKTYQQALGLLPDAEDPECPCYPAAPGPDKVNFDVSCSCSEDEASLESDTDSDEWMVEFTPPVALFDPTFKGKKPLKSDNSSQYTYLDYRVKLLDRYGNQVPRFFKYLDGSTKCSDLGGFWGPDKKWLEINVDGYIAPDGRWAPMQFIGPNGEVVDCDSGKFQASNGAWLIVGVDGYIDCHGRWKKYSRPKPAPAQYKARAQAGKKAAGKKPGSKKHDKNVINIKSEATWSCFGDVDPVELSKLGIVGHGHDRKLLKTALQQLKARGDNVKIPQPSTVPRLPPDKRAKAKRRMMSPNAYNSYTYFRERTTCRHPVPSEKGIVAVNDRGNKTYFRLKDYKNRRPKQRLVTLAKQGISLSSFHVPCLHSFINSEALKQQLLQRRMDAAVQADVH